MLLRATKPSVSPTSVEWQFYDFDLNTWRNDTALTVTGLSETEYDHVTVEQRTEKAESNEVNEEDSEEEGAESLENLPYSHGAIDRAQAESRLKDGHIGTYLVRFEIIIFGSNRSSGCHFV